jgi:hypothetical protein
MGMSTPTTTDALDTFVERYRAYRSELAPASQRLFDRLVAYARRNSHAINRRPHLDFERPVFLAMLLEAVHEHEAAQRRLAATEKRLEEVERALDEAGLVVRRVPRPTPEQLDRVGQARLPRGQTARPVPA